MNSASRAAGSVVMAGAADEVTPASRTAWSVGKERATTHPGLSCTTTRVRMPERLVPDGRFPRRRERLEMMTET